MIKKFNGNQLFGIDNHTIQSLNKKQKIPKCSPQEWKDDFTIGSLFDFYLKWRTIANINWRQLFIKWDKQLIELHNELCNIYLKNHQFSIREIRAWQAFLCAAGANNVTPWSHEEQVLLKGIY